VIEDEEEVEEEEESMSDEEETIGTLGQALGNEIARMDRKIKG